MANAPSFLSSAGRILVVRLSAMGDVIHALPAVAALREALPGAEIGWVVEERWAELLSSPQELRSGARSPLRPLVERIHSVNTRAWRKSWASPQTRKAIAASRRELRSAGYDAVVDFQGSIRSAMIARWAGAPIAGFTKPRERPAAWLYRSKFPARGVHVVEQNLSLARAALGRSLEQKCFLLPRDFEAEDKADAFLREQQIARFVLVNPGAGWGAKMWPQERYGEVIRGLARFGLKAVINAGPGEEEMARKMASECGGTVVSGPITQLIALTRRASVFIGGDTGPMHLAAALNVPVVAIFGPTDPARNGPFGTTSKVLRSASSLTSYSHRKEQDSGILEIQPEEVLGAAEELLGTGA